ncbi:MAG: hypothetical protein LBF93_04515 [Zoogloeaceae bacterium]|nr:hypothetical protein [Zoogloeaceae bacterium]
MFSPSGEKHRLPVAAGLPVVVVMAEEISADTAVVMLEGLSADTAVLGMGAVMVVAIAAGEISR